MCYRLWKTSKSGYLSPFFLLQKPKIMKKFKHFIKDLVDNHKKAVALAGLLTVAGVGDAMAGLPGHVSTNERFVYKNIPHLNIQPSIYANITSTFGRISPFVQFSQRARLFGEQLEHLYSTYHSHLFEQARPPALESSLLTEIQSSNLQLMPFYINAGIDFRIVRGTNLRIALGNFSDLSFGINNSANLSRRLRLKSSLEFTRGESQRNILRTERVYGSLDGMNNTLIRQEGPILRTNKNAFSKIKAGVKFKINVAPNLDLRLGMGASRKFNIRDASSEIASTHSDTGHRGRVTIPETLSLIHPSVGLSFKIPFGGFETPTAPRVRTQRPPRRQQMAPCPHMQPRPWETVQPFNHPIAR